MDIDQAVTLTQDRLAAEGGTMGDLLGHFRNRISPVLVGDPEWERILACAGRHPITMGALPFGFELPLHERSPEADFGCSLASGTRAAAFFEERARTDPTDATARSIARLFAQMDAEGSPLRAIVGRKLMLEYDIGSARDGERAHPAMFLRPGERPILGARDRVHDVATVVDALVACAGWERNDGERRNVERAYLAQPEDTRMDSFGVFPSRTRSIRLAVMGFKTRQELGSYLEDTGWPGRIPAVDAVIARFRERANVVRTGVNIDVRAGGSRSDARPDAHRQAEVHQGLTLLARRPDRLGSVPGGPGPRGARGSGEARGAGRLGIEADAAVREDRALRAAARHSPHEARDVRR